MKTLEALSVIANTVVYEEKDNNFKETNFANFPNEFELIKKDLEELQALHDYTGVYDRTFLEYFKMYHEISQKHFLELVGRRNKMEQMKKAPTSDEVCEALKEEDEFNGCEVTFEDKGDKIRFRIHFGEYKFDTCFTYFVYHDQVNFEAYDYISLKTYKMMVDFFDNYKKELEGKKDE